MDEVHKTPAEILANEINYYVENLGGRKPSRKFLNNYFFDTIIGCQSCYNEAGILNKPDSIRADILKAEEGAGSSVNDKEFANFAGELCRKCEKANFPFSTIRRLIKEVLNS